MNGYTKNVSLHLGFPHVYVNLSSLSCRHLYDGIHFTSEGYREMAQLVADALQRAFEAVPR